MLKISTITLDVASQRITLQDIVHYYYNEDKIVFVNLDGSEASYFALEIEVINVETKELTNSDFTVNNFENYSFI